MPGQHAAPHARREIAPVEDFRVRPFLPFCSCAAARVLFILVVRSRACSLPPPTRATFFAPPLINHAHASVVTRPQAPIALIGHHGRGGG